MDKEENLLAIQHLENAPINPATAVAAVALNMSLKWHDVTIIKDGQMYQQLKLEGKEIEPVSLNSVFDVAKQFEEHLALAPSRMANLIVDALADGMAKELEDPIHPGVIIRDELLPALSKHNKLDPDQVAPRLGISLNQLNMIINGNAPVTEKLARRIRREFGFDSDQLLWAQKRYDEVHPPKSVGTLLAEQLAALDIPTESAAASLNVTVDEFMGIVNDEVEISEPMINLIADTFMLDSDVLDDAYIVQRRNKED